MPQSGLNQTASVPNCMGSETLANTYHRDTENTEGDTEGSNTGEKS